MSAALFADALDGIEPGLRGQEWLLAFGHALRRKQAEFSDISALIAQAPAVEEIDRQTRALLHSQMKAADLQGESALRLQQAIQALVTGWMVFEHSQHKDQMRVQGLADDAFNQGLSALIAGFGEANLG